MITPRTDEASLVDTNYDVETVKADFARQLERENAALSAQVAELRKDAERYRWLRTDRHILMGMAFYSNEELDATIDAALRRQEKI
jgi:hypothetical protein